MKPVQWETIPYEASDGMIPVYVFLDSLPSKKAAKVLRDIQVLESYGPTWGMPHVGPLPEGMYELRTVQGSDIFRTFFFPWRRTALVLTSGYVKKSQELDKREFDRAKRYRDEWLKRKDGGK